MPANSLLQLMLLGAIWGSSFMFLRIAVSSFGPVMLIESRLMLAALFLGLLSVIRSQPGEFKKHWPHYLLLGSINTAFPFLLLGYAAKYLPVSFLVTLNATGPIWTVIILFILTRQLPAWKTIFGTLLGVMGVYILVADNAGIEMSPQVVSAICAGLTATIGYAAATVYTSRCAVKVSSFQNALGSMWAAALVLLPAAPFYPIYEVPELSVAMAVLMLGVVCTGCAYLLYFKLIKDIGPTPALSVTYLIPMFGMLWGSLFLGESLNWHHIVGALTVVIGTAFVAGFKLPCQKVKDALTQ